MKYSKIDFLLGKFIGPINKLIRLFFPWWNQKMISQLEIETGRSVVSFASRFIEDVTGYVPPVKEYMANFNKLAYEDLCEWQWVYNWILIDEWPLSSIWYTMLAGGVITEEMYKNRIRYFYTLDKKWQVGEFQNMAALNRNHYQGFEPFEIEEINRVREALNKNFSRMEAEGL